MFTNDDIFDYILNLQLIICGLGKIDVNDWKANTRLKHCTPDSNIVKWFWKAVEFFDEERRARLLQFVTGSSRVPLQGFKALQGKFLQKQLQMPALGGSNRTHHRNIS